MRSLLLLALVLAPAIARADSPDDLADLPPDARARARALDAEARPHFVLGFKAFNDKDYRTASAEFELAYKLDPQVPLLFTWAQSERLAGNCSHALELYQKYLYSDINQQQAEFARRWIKACGGVVGSSTTPKPPPVVEAPAPAYVWYKDVPADGLAASGVLGLVIGAIYFLGANHAADAASTTHDLGVFKQSNADASHDNKIGAVAMSVGGVLAIAGVGLYVYDAKHHRPVAVTTDGQTVSLATTF